MKKVFLPLLIICWLFSGCGFRPVYSSQNSVDTKQYEQNLTAIGIAVKKKHLDQAFKNNLLSELNPKNLTSEEKYILNVTLKESYISTYTAASGSSGRNRVILFAEYNLIEKASGEVIFRGSSSVKDDYNVSANRFANYITREEIFINLTKTLSANIRDLLINFFTQQERHEEERRLNFPASVTDSDSSVEASSQVSSPSPSAAAEKKN